MTDVSDHIDAGIFFVESLFERIGAASFDGIGFTRAAYGEGEAQAHAAVADAALALGLEVERDAALNLIVTLRGSDPELPRLLVGSHLDAVPQGGNFDGLAGVLAGIACLFAWKTAGVQPRRDLCVVAIRAEESAWFGAQHIGSRAMLGTLDPVLLDTARRTDTGLTLGEHMQDAGVDLPALVSAAPLDRQRIGAYVELHIEQGPVLVDRGLPIGIVTGIRGNRRCRRIRCHGAYGHSGTVPRDLRRDAVMACAELVMAMDELWQRIETAGEDLVLTFGQFATDERSHSVTTIPGQATLAFDARSHSCNVLDRVEAALRTQAARIEAQRGVCFEFDAMTGDDPASMDAGLQDRLAVGARVLSIPAQPIASGAGHDAGDFSAAGVPSAMIFVRNDKGSHNPDEAMALDDFAQGVRLLAWLLADLDGTVP